MKASDWVKREIDQTDGSLEALQQLLRWHESILREIHDEPRYEMVKLLKEMITERMTETECGYCGTPLNDSCGKSLGCYGCDEEFCSSDCLDVHEKATGHREKNFPVEPTEK